MSDCSKHRKDVFGETDMVKLAEEIGNLHYEALDDLFTKLSDKFEADSKTCYAGGRKRLSQWLRFASRNMKAVRNNIFMAGRLNKPYMKSP